MLVKFTLGLLMGVKTFQNFWSLFFSSPKTLFYDCDDRFNVLFSIFTWKKVYFFPQIYLCTSFHTHTHTHTSHAPLHNLALRMSRTHFSAFSSFFCLNISFENKKKSPPMFIERSMRGRLSKFQKIFVVNPKGKNVNPFSLLTFLFYFQCCFFPLLSPISHGHFATALIKVAINFEVFFTYQECIFRISQKQQFLRTL